MKCAYLLVVSSLLRGHLGLLATLSLLISRLLDLDFSFGRRIFFGLRSAVGSLGRRGVELNLWLLNRIGLLWCLRFIISILIPGRHAGVVLTLTSSSALRFFDFDFSAVVSSTSSISTSSSEALALPFLDFLGVAAACCLAISSSWNCLSISL